MAFFRAVDMILELQSVSSPSDWVSVGALKNVQMQITNSEEDVSAKKHNQARALFPEGAQKSYTISADFVLDDTDEFEQLQAAAESATPSIAARCDDGSRLYTGTWQITQWQVQGAAFGAVQGSITLQSSETVIASAS